MSAVHERDCVSHSPLRAAPLALSELTQAGVQRCLAQFPTAVMLDASGRFDVGLVDPSLVPDGWREPFGRPVVAIVRDESRSASIRARQLGALVVIGPPVEPESLVDGVRQAYTQWLEVVAHELSGLSAREREVLSLICLGKSNVEISAELFLSVNSIKTYIRTAYRKMGVASRSQAVLWGLRHGL